MGQPVRVVSPDGQSGTLDSDELPSAVQQGFRLETPDEANQRDQQAKYGDQTLQAGAEGAARGFTLGLSDPLLEGFGVDASDLKGRKEANPKAALVGEVGGTLASALRGPGGLVAKLGEGAEELFAKEGAGLGRKLLAKAAGGAAEGAVYGAGEAVSDSTLNNEPLQADYLLAHMGLGAVLGGVGNSAIAAAGTGAKAIAAKAAEGLGEGGMKDVLQKFSRERALKAAGFIGSDLNKVDPAKQQEIAEDLLQLGRDGKWKAGDKAEKVLAAVKDAQKEAGAKSGEILKTVDDSLAAQGKAFDATGALKDIRTDILPKFDDPAFESQKAQLEKLLAGYDEKAAQGPITFEQARKWKTNLQKTISKFTDTPIAQQAKADLQRAIDDHIESQLGKVAGADVLAQYQEAKRLYGSFAEASKAGKKALNRQLGNRSVSLTDYLTGIGGAAAGVATGNVAPVILGGVATLANKILRERGSSAFAIAADKLANESTLHGALLSFQKRLESGTMDAIGSISGAGRKAVTQPAVAGLLDSPIARADASPKDKRDAMAQHLDELAQLTANPKLLTDRISAATGAINNLSPTLGPALAAKATRAIEFLNGVAPKPPPGTMMTAFDGTQKWHPSDAEVSRFERHLAAVSNPLSIYDNLKQGTVTKEAVEALQAVYPELYTDIQKRLLEGLGGVKEQLPYAKRLALSQLFNVPMVTAMKPDMLALLQSSFAQKQQAGGPPPPGGPPVDIAKGAATNTQRIMGG
jgi:hypothetical protein